MRFGAEAAVVGAATDVEDCFDLMDIAWEHAIANAPRRFLQQLAQSGAEVPRQTRGAHRLGRRVLNYPATNMADDGLRVRSIRAVFAETTADLSRLGVAEQGTRPDRVRDPRAIVRTWRLTRED